jgi:hypothetical protein
MRGPKSTRALRALHTHVPGRNLGLGQESHCLPGPNLARFITSRRWPSDSPPFILRDQKPAPGPASPPEP